MKLFGNKPSGRKRPASRQVHQTEPMQTPHVQEPVQAPVDANETPIDPRRIRRPRKKPWYATGKGRGLVLLIAAVLLLSGVVWGGIAMVTAPPERPSTDAKEPVVEAKPENPTPEKKPDKVTVPTIDKETGDVVEVEYEAPGSYKEGFYNILVVGTDDDGTRTDTIMIARLNAKDHTVALMSMPRDTYISINNTVPKLNSVYGLNGKGESGIKALRNQLKAILGFEVDYYVMVDMEAFEETVNLVGGLEFNVPVRMYYSDPTQGLYIDFAPGAQWLYGADALNMIRFRGYASADIGRTEVQQDFLKALAKRCLDVGNVSKIPEFVDIFLKYVDTDLTATDMIYFGSELLKCNFDDMYTVTPPGYATWHGDASCYSLYQGKLCDIVNEYFNPYDQDIPLSSIHVRQGPVPSTTTSTKPAPSTSNNNSTPQEEEKPSLDVEEEESQPQEEVADPEENTSEEQGNEEETPAPEENPVPEEVPDVEIPAEPDTSEPSVPQEPSEDGGLLDPDFGT